MSKKQIAKPVMKMVMIYAHKDRKLLKHLRLLDFLEGLARYENWEFWWDDKLSQPLFDEEIKSQLNQADIVICLISQPFLNSDYITHVEAKITSKRLKSQGILVVPVLFDASLWKDVKWIKALNPIPAEGDLRSSKFKNEIYYDIVEAIRLWYHERALPFRDPQMVYKLRRLPESRLSKEQVRVLVKDSCDRANRMVPNMQLQKLIVKAAKALIKNKQPLNKKKLEQLDRRFLAGNTRKPDAEIIRWVLRCSELHPQGRVGRETA